MATSGTVTYRASASVIIRQALLAIAAIDQHDTGAPTATQTADALVLLNMLIKSWQARGLQLWETEYGVVFPQTDQSVFVLGSPGPAGDHACISSPLGYGFVQTTLSAAAASGASTIAVASLSNTATAGVSATTMATGYNIGIQLDSGTIQWTTINGAATAASVPLTVALTGAAASGNYVFSYQTKMIRPLRILDGFVRQLSGTNDIPVKVISREEYNRYGAKTSEGTPIQLYYDPQENTGHLYLYPRFSTTAQLLYIQYQSPMEDFATASDDFDMPQEWMLALVYNLALLCAPTNVVPADTFKQVKELAGVYFSLLDGWDQEVASVLIQPQMFPYQMG